MTRQPCMLVAINMLIVLPHFYCLQTWLHHKQAFRCLHGFVPYVKRDELVRAGSVISKTFTPLYQNQSVANFHIFGCLTRNARWVQPDLKARDVRSSATALQPCKHIYMCDHTSKVMSCMPVTGVCMPVTRCFIKLSWLA